MLIHRWLPVALVVVLAAAMSACSGATGGGAGGSTESTSGLPIAAAPSPRAEPSGIGYSSVSGSEPAWAEPADPVAAYRELIAKVAYLRAYPSRAMVDEIYAPRSRMARQRAEIERMVERGIRVVDGRTVLEEVRLLSKDSDTAFVRVHSREEGWVTVDAEGDRTAMPSQCEQFVVELRDRGEGWRIATLIVDDTSFRRCEE